MVGARVAEGGFEPVIELTKESTEMQPGHDFAHPRVRGCSIDVAAIG
jgi:hypothetical protein